MCVVGSQCLGHGRLCVGHGQLCVVSSQSARYIKLCAIGSQCARWPVMAGVYTCTYSIL